MMKKFMIFVVVVCLAVPSMVMAEGFNVAVSNGFITHSWRTQMVNNLQKTVAYYQGQGLIGDFQIQHAGFDVDLQINHVRNFINSDIDLLIIDPLSATALNPVLEEAVEAGIMVVGSDEPLTSDEVWQVIPTHDVWMEKLARYVFERMGKKGNVVYLSGIDGAPASDQRDDGFERALKDYPDIKLLTKVFGSWDPALAQQAMADVLAAYPEIDGVVAHDGECLSVLRAFESANREAPIVNGSGFRPFFEYWIENLDNGFTSYAIANGPGFAMTASVGVGLRLLQGKQIKPELLDGKVLYLDHRYEIHDADVKEALATHTQFRGVEDYIDEVWTAEEVDALFE